MKQEFYEVNNNLYAVEKFYGIRKLVQEKSDIPDIEVLKRKFEDVYKLMADNLESIGISDDNYIDWLEGRFDDSLSEMFIELAIKLRFQDDLKVVVFKRQ